ncbi:hypothetical protein [Kitasatospora sp. HPMI-4]|uniref:hypothetical protein n=1 Tax=Kitasatospora sp. HPMI-4 TaxID=3448443 RepID=UPI003F194A0D
MNDELEPEDTGPPPEQEPRPLLTPEELTDRPLSPEEYAKRVELLRKLRHINKLT